MSTPEPEVLDELPTRCSANKKYPWTAWLADGRPRKFIQGTHFQTSPRRFAAAAYKWAEDHGYACESRLEADTVCCLQFSRRPGLGRPPEAP